jgi:putative inorganic carbon (HCO3(-)) transporter
MFPSVLAESRVFQSMTQIHGKGQALWNTLWLNSFMGRGIQSLFSRHATSVPAAVLGVFPALGILALLLGTSFLETGLLGALVFALGAWVWGFSVWTGRNGWVKHAHVLDALVLLFFVTYAVSAAFSSVQPEAFIGLAKQSIFWVAYITFRSTWHHAPQLMRWGMPLLFLLGGVESVLGWMQVHGYAGELAGWTDANTPEELKLNRVYGSLKPYNPNLLAAFLVASGGAGLWSMLQVALKPWRYVWPFIILSTLLMGLVVYGILMTGCRGAYVAIFVSVLTLFITAYPLLRTDAALKRYPSLQGLWLGAAFLGIIGVAGALFSSEKLLHRVTSIFAFREDSSISYRLNVYHSAWRMFVDNWLFGIGPSNTVFKKIYGYYMTPGFNALGAYSVPLEILVEQVLLGFSVFLTVLGTLFHKTVEALFNTGKPLAQKLSVLSLSIGLIAFMGHGLFDTILYRPPIMLPFLFMLSGLITFLVNDEIN